MPDEDDCGIETFSFFYFINKVQQPFKDTRKQPVFRQDG